jgi:preprotein translocase subunit Sec61beta
MTGDRRNEARQPFRQAGLVRHSNRARLMNIDARE